MDRDLGRLLREIARRTFTQGPRTAREGTRCKTALAIRPARDSSTRDIATARARARSTFRRSYMA